MWPSMWPSMLWSVDSCQNSVSADQYRLTVSRAQFVDILYCMACSTSIQDGENSVFWLVTWAGLSCPIGISRFVPLRSRLLVTDNKTFIDQAWYQGGWILALFYLYHKLPLGLYNVVLPKKLCLQWGKSLERITRRNKMRKIHRSF